MPNWVRHEFSIVGETKELKKIYEDVFLQANGELEFDFDKIVPMPKDLEMGCSGDHAICGNRFRTSATELELEERIGQLVKENKEKINSQNGMVRFVRDKLIAEGRLRPESGNEDEKYFEKGVERYIREEYNLQKYGYQDWYEWSWNNWGTKWNSCANDIKVEYDQNNEIECISGNFETAWSTPKPVFDAMSRRYPNLSVDIDFCDEDYFSKNAGTFEYENGSLKIYKEPKTEEQAGEYAVKLGFWEAEDVICHSVGVGSIDCMTEEKLKELTEDKRKMVYPPSADGKSPIFKNLRPWEYIDDDTICYIPAQGYTEDGELRVYSKEKLIDIGGCEKNAQTLLNRLDGELPEELHKKIMDNPDKNKEYAAIWQEQDKGAEEKGTAEKRSKEPAADNEIER